MSGKRLKKSKKHLQNITLYCIITRKRFEMDLYFIILLYSVRDILSLIPKFFYNWTDNDKMTFSPAPALFFYLFSVSFLLYKKTALYGNGTVSPEVAEVCFRIAGRKIIYHREHIHFWRWKERGETDFRKAARWAVQAVQWTFLLWRSRHPALAGWCTQYARRDCQGMLRQRRKKLHAGLHQKFFW